MSEFETLDAHFCGCGGISEDAQALEACGRDPLQVRCLSSALMSRTRRHVEKTFRTEVVCKKCGGKGIELTHTAKSMSKHDYLCWALMAHDGFGFDLNWFKAKCASCGSVKAVKFKTIELPD